jgi:ApbE family
VVAWIHRNRGIASSVDEETASLLGFASRCYELSEGLVDTTSGMVRRVWKFDGSDGIPDNTAIKGLLALVGLNKLRWHSESLLLLAEMALDIGGIGKEHAVDRAYDLAVARRSNRFLINLSGDLLANRPPTPPHPQATTLGGFGADVVAEGLASSSPLGDPAPTRAQQGLLDSAHDPSHSRSCAEGPSA